MDVVGRVWVGLALLAAVLGGGCETSHVPPSSEVSNRPFHQSDSAVGRLTRRGLEALHVDRGAEALAAFNGALSLAPSHAGLHVLAGLAYHLDYLEGNFAARDLAETGYLVATQLDPSLTQAHVQLGRLYLDSKRPAQAQAAFLKALDAEPDNVEAVYGLVVASYYARDLEGAVGSVRRLQALRPTSVRGARAAVLVFAAAGLDAEAGAARALFDDLGGAAAEVRLLDRRMEQWRALHAQIEPHLARADDENDDYGIDRSFGRNAEGSDGDGEDKPTTQDGPRPIAPNWADCQQWLAGSSSDSSFSTYDDGDDDGSGTVSIRPLRPLPSPCTGQAMPRMAVIDATIIRTEEMQFKSHGVNLLDGLSVMFTGSSTITHGTSGSSRSHTITAALPAAGVTYSLNIANATDLRNDVLARPSLIALDRQPSVFFSGNNVTVSVSGSLTDGELEDKLIGVSLAVTPTFIDDDTMLLAVKVTRSAIEPATAGTFTEALNSSLNSVSANVTLRMDQTLVLSGLTEKSNETVRDRTPLLGDIPVLQYLFSNAQREEVQRSILVVLTPRRADFGEDSAKTVSDDPRVAEARERLRRDLTLPSGALSVMRLLASNRFVAHYRSGDLRADSWRAQGALDRLIDDLSGLLYF